MGGPSEVGSDQIETFIENHERSISWETADLLKISKAIELLVKMKNVSFIFMETN